MTTLFVGLDAMVALRRSGGGRDPDPALAAALAELAGAEGICIGCRRGRDESTVRDLRVLREVVRTTLNVCLSPAEECLSVVLDVRPDLATFVSESREGSGADQGVDVEDRREELLPMVESLKSSGIAVGVLVDPSPTQVKAAHRLGAGVVVLHTGRLAWASEPAGREAEFERLVNAAKIGQRLGLAIHAAGGLHYQSVVPVAQVEEVETVHVGHGLAARAALVGVQEAVREMLRKLAGGRSR